MDQRKAGMAKTYIVLLHPATVASVLQVVQCHAAFGGPEGKVLVNVVWQRDLCTLGAHGVDLRRVLGHTHLQAIRRHLCDQRR